MNVPIRQSYLDLVKRNLQAMDQVMFLTRIIYIGEYRCTSEELRQKMKNVMDHLANDHSDSPATGLLLVYQQYFIHILEATEEIIFRHFRLIYADGAMQIDLGRVICLPPYHHVYQKFFRRWFAVFAKPPILLEKLETTGLSEIEKQITNCLFKLYTLCEYILDTYGITSVSMEEVLSHLGEKVPQCLPESAVLEFLLKVDTPVLKDVEEYLELYMKVPQIDFYNDKIWPPTCDFVPYDILDGNVPRRDVIMLNQQSQQQQRHH
ncbi:testis-expressed protein 47 isoform X1 [Cephus cinctus]|uniref:Testis-expressed protein 47 isoform X1 n=1 Tax=Cephus cinctus TaxID=211228 RepID=A0AAJ7W8H6_CEPCN|nr:testis-expressed protein 47 isoform X1 [Cephus cinctus]